MARQRDYKAEYQRRLERGAAAGLTRTQARRSGPKGTQGFSRVLQSITNDLEKGRYKSPREAVAAYNRAKYEPHGGVRTSRVDVERLREYMKSTGQAEVRGGKLAIMEQKGTYQVPIISDGRVFVITVDRTNATKAGKYMNAAGQFIYRHNPRPLEAWDNQSIVDVNGQNYPLETDQSALTVVYEFEDVNKLWDKIYKLN